MMMQIYNPPERLRFEVWSLRLMDAYEPEIACLVLRC